MPAACPSAIFFHGLGTIWNSSRRPRAKNSWIGTSHPNTSSHSSMHSYILLLFKIFIHILNEKKNHVTDSWIPPSPPPAPPNLHHWKICCSLFLFRCNMDTQKCKFSTQRKQKRMVGDLPLLDKSRSNKRWSFFLSLISINPMIC